MEIVKAKCSPELFPIELIGYNAMDGNFIAKHNQEEISFPIFDIIQDAYIILNQDFDDKLGAVMAKQFSFDLQLKYKYLTIEEVRLAITMGVKEELESFKMFPVMSLYNLNSWVKAYLIKIRNPILTKQQKYQEKLAAQTDSGKEAIRIGHLRAEIIKVYETFCEGRPIITEEGEKVFEPCTIEEILSFTPYPHHLMSVYYQHLRKYLTIDLDDAETWQLYYKAQKQVESEEPPTDPIDQIFISKSEARVRDLSRAFALTAIFTKWKESGYSLMFQ